MAFLIPVLPTLFINTLKAQDIYFVTITIRLDEIVRPVRNQSVKTIATTWEVAATGTANQNMLAKEVEKLLDDLIEYFVYDFRLENPS